MSNATTKNTGRGYELYVMTLIDELLQELLGRRLKSVRFRHNTRLKGTLGITYQIDILGETDREFFIVECKDHGGVLDHKMVTAFISKCIDIANHHVKKTIYGIIIDTAGYYPSAVSSKQRKIWNTSRVNLEEQIRILRIGFDKDYPFAVVYEFKGPDVLYFPLISGDTGTSSVDSLVSDIKRGDDLGVRILKGFQLIKRLKNGLRSSEETRRELESIAIENVSNCFLHLSRYFDADYFARRLLKLTTKKNIDSYYEGQLITTIAHYKIAQIGKPASKRPALKEVHQLMRLIDKADGISKTQLVSSKLFLGLWIARHEDREFGFRMIRECQVETEREEFRDSKWHQCVALLRTGELAREEDVAMEALHQANNLISGLCDKHSPVAKQYLTKISEYRKQLL